MPPWAVMSREGTVMLIRKQVVRLGQREPLIPDVPQVSDATLGSVPSEPGEGLDPQGAHTAGAFHKVHLAHRGTAVLKQLSQTPPR